MQEGTRIKDRFGLPLSTHSQVAVDHWQEGVDRMLSQDYAPEEKLRQALDIDEGFALAHGCQAYVGMIRGDAARQRRAPTAPADWHQASRNGRSRLSRPSASGSMAKARSRWRWPASI